MKKSTSSPSPTTAPTERRGFRSLRAVLASVIIVGSLFMTSSPASAAVRGLDLQYSGCNAQAPGTYIVLRARNVYGWRCTTGWWDFGINMNQACRYVRAVLFCIFSQLLGSILVALPLILTSLPVVAQLDRRIEPTLQRRNSEAHDLSGVCLRLVLYRRWARGLDR